jgi:hypothetical protein
METLAKDKVKMEIFLDTQTLKEFIRHSLQETLKEVLQGKNKSVLLQINNTRIDYKCRIWEQLLHFQIAWFWTSNILGFQFSHK